MRLFQYMAGRNEERKYLALTKPIVVRVLAGPGPSCGSEFIVSMYLGGETTQNPPTPTDERLFIEERPRTRIAVKQFGGCE